MQGTAQKERKNILQCKKIDTAIDRAKKMLIERVKQNGIYENFGKVEAGKIECKFIRQTAYSNNRKMDEDKLRHFDNWCMRYNGE